jgi:hypothetical protein
VQNSEKGPFYHLSPGNVDVGSGRYTAAARHAEALVKVMERHVTLSMEVKSELQRKLHECSLSLTLARVRLNPQN